LNGKTALVLGGGGGIGRVVATTLAKEGVKVAIADVNRGALDQTVKEIRENRSVEDVAAESTASIPVGRYGTPQEYANVVTFLASTAASYLTGSTIRVDGGYLANI
jgi:3-oxoacyl-[acyl-carrier protein] reductase